ncbi:MAG TPA: septum formation initiator family protein, partial [Jiangellales bacterium]|nr:septum formation initiator family protein [Jiangellales bacterium]
AARTGSRATPRPDATSRPRRSRADRPPPASRTGGAVGRRPSVTGRAAVLALVLAVLAVSYAYPLRAWWDQHARVAELEAEQETLAEGVTELENELQRWDDPAYVRAQARERLGFVPPGEVGFVVVGAEDEVPDEVLVGASGTGDDATGQAVTAVGTEGPWWSRLSASLAAADAVPEPVEAPAAEDPVP